MANTNEKAEHEVSVMNSLRRMRYIFHVVVLSSYKAQSPQKFVHNDFQRSLLVYTLADTYNKFNNLCTIFNV